MAVDALRAEAARVPPIQDPRESPWPDNHEFALCLTHDIDHIRKTYQYWTGLRKRGGLRRFLSDRDENPYWNFERIMDLESGYGVRSTFFFLEETMPFSFFDRTSWAISPGKYRFSESDVADVIRRLDSRGWEVGLHGSYRSFRDKPLLAEEKRSLESVLRHPVRGVRQHYLNLEIPGTWRIQEELGFTYDASLGSRTSVGYWDLPVYPFAPEGGHLIVLPLAVMDGALFRITSERESRLGLLKDLVCEAENRHALLSMLWHQRFLNPYEFPEENALYEAFLRLALDRRPWVATAGEVAAWWRNRVLGNPE